MPPTLPTTRRVALAASVAALTFGVAGCGSTSTDSSSGGTSTTQASTAVLSLEDGWVKAVELSTDPAESSSDASEGSMAHDATSMPMTAMFGTLRNGTDSDVTVTGGASPAAGTVELHETVRTDSGGMQMQPKPGGFVVPAGGDYTLQPGGDHVMLLGLTQSLPNGTETTVTLQTSAGEVSFTVPVRSFTGAEESYAPSPSTSSS